MRKLPRRRLRNRPRANRPGGDSYFRLRHEFLSGRNKYLCRPENRRRGAGGSVPNCQSTVNHSPGFRLYGAGASPGSKIPGLKTFTMLLVALLLAATSACAARYTVHPGALNKTDSAAYDILLVAETAIDQARLAYKSGQLPAGAKPALDVLVRSYNLYYGCALSRLRF